MHNSIQKETVFTATQVASLLSATLKTHGQYVSLEELETLIRNTVSTVDNKQQLSQCGINKDFHFAAPQTTPNTETYGLYLNKYLFYKWFTESIQKKKNTSIDGYMCTEGKSLISHTDSNKNIDLNLLLKVIKRNDINAIYHKEGMFIDCYDIVDKDGLKLIQIKTNNQILPFNILDITGHSLNYIPEEFQQKHDTLELLNKIISKEPEKVKNINFYNEEGTKIVLGDKQQEMLTALQYLNYKENIRAQVLHFSEKEKLFSVISNINGKEVPVILVLVEHHL